MVRCTRSGLKVCSLFQTSLTKSGFIYILCIQFCRTLELALVLISLPAQTCLFRRIIVSLTITTVTSTATATAATSRPFMRGGYRGVVFCSVFFSSFFLPSCFFYGNGFQSEPCSSCFYSASLLSWQGPHRHY